MPVTAHPLCLLLAVLLLPTASTAAKPPRPPGYVSRIVAGVELSGGEEIRVYDSRTGYYLVRWRECCGGPTGLLLTPSRQKAAEEVDLESLKTRPIRSLATGHGVAIGDTLQTVRQKLGMPTRLPRRGRRAQEWTYTYLYRYPDGASVMEYRADYTFRDGRLRQIELAENFIEGG
jgi:hypothetical protein